MIEIPFPSQRSAMEMCVDILRVCEKSPTRITKICYGANINCSSLKKNYFPLLISKGLLKQHDVYAVSCGVNARKLSRNPKKVSVAYETTQKGKEIIKKYSELLNLWFSLDVIVETNLANAARIVT